MEKKLFGTLPTGEEIYLYTLHTDDATVNIMNRGATIVNFIAYGTDIVGGFDTLETYLNETSHQGAVIGRVANRVAKAQFEMDGTVYKLPENDHGNCLHGGDGFDHKVWEVTDYSDTEITLEYVSKDGEEGFPAELKVAVTYKLNGAKLLIDYVAFPNGKTPIALTNHAYFNLDGFGGTIEDHEAVIYADSYTEVDDDLIPNGNRPAVEGTVFDFKTPHKIGDAERTSSDTIITSFSHLIRARSFSASALISLRTLRARSSDSRFIPISPAFSSISEISLVTVLTSEAIPSRCSTARSALRLRPSLTA